MAENQTNTIFSDHQQFNSQNGSNVFTTQDQQTNAVAKK